MNDTLSNRTSGMRVMADEALTCQEYELRTGLSDLAYLVELAENTHVTVNGQTAHLDLRQKRQLAQTAQYAQRWVNTLMKRLRQDATDEQLGLLGIPDCVD